MAYWPYILAAVSIIAALYTVLAGNLINALVSFMAVLVPVGIMVFGAGLEFLGMVMLFLYVGAVFVVIAFAVIMYSRDRPKARPNNRITSLWLAGSVAWVLAISAHSESLSHRIVKFVPNDAKAVSQAFYGDRPVLLVLCAGLFATAIAGVVILGGKDKQ